MKVNPIQLETFGTTSRNVVSVAKKGYSVMIGDEKYLVGVTSEKNNILTPFLHPAKQMANKTNIGKVNYLA